MLTLKLLLDRKGRQVHAIGPDAPVIEAVRDMAENHIGALLVMEGQKLVGILSERDYARKIALKGRSSSDTPVRDIMTTPVITVLPDCTVEEAMRVMTTHRVRHLPVAASGRVLGVISIGDLVSSIIDDQKHLIDELQHYIQG